MGPEESGLTPDIHCKDFETAVKEKDMELAWSVLHAILGDVLDSVKLAMESQPGETPDQILTTVKDYISNYYD